MNKSPEAFKTISEVAEDMDLPQHVLRFWETRFTQIKPMKRGGGRRYYRPDDVDLLRGIKHLLYSEGYTIRGVQRLLKEKGNKFVVAIGKGETPPEATDPAALVEAPQKAAMSVAELAEPTGGASSMTKGLLGRLRGKDTEPDDSMASPLTSDERRSLQSTLYELLECKRLLDQVR